MMKDKALAITSQLSLEKMFCCKFLWQKKKATSRLREAYRLKERQTEVKITYLYIPLYLYLPYLYPNISGLTLVLNTCGIKHTHTHFLYISRHTLITALLSRGVNISCCIQIRLSICLKRWKENFS